MIVINKIRIYRHMLRGEWFVASFMMLALTSMGMTMAWSTWLMGLEMRRAVMTEEAVKRMAVKYDKKMEREDEDAKRNRNVAQNRGGVKDGSKRTGARRRGHGGKRTRLAGNSTGQLHTGGTSTGEKMKGGRP